MIRTNPFLTMAANLLNNSLSNSQLHSIIYPYTKAIWIRLCSHDDKNDSLYLLTCCGCVVPGELSVFA